MADLGLPFAPAAFPVEFLALGGLGPGVPVRANVTDFGPQLLGKVLGANDTQEASLALVFHYADTNGLPLVDLADLRALLTFLDSDAGKAELKGIGGLSSQTVGVLLRSLVGLETGGGTEFFGEPQLDVADLMRTTPDGRGIISCLELAAVQDKPVLWSTALMWLVAELFESLPEAGDLAQAEARLLPRRGPPAVRGRDEGVPRVGRADRAADPVQGRRRLLRHPAADRHPRRGARPARRARPARAAGVHAERREGPARDGLDVSALGVLRPRDAADLDGHRGGGGDAALRVRRPDAGRPHAARRARVADGAGRRRRRRGEGLAAVGALRRADRPAERARDPRRPPRPVRRAPRPRRPRRRPGRRSPSRPSSTSRSPSRCAARSGAGRGAARPRPPTAPPTRSATSSTRARAAPSRRRSSAACSAC